MTRHAIEAAVDDLQARLEQDAEVSRREWWTKYLKGEAVFRGTPMAGVRHHVHAWWREHDYDELEGPELLEVPLHLLRQPVTEDKLAGILVLGERLVPSGRLDVAADLPRLAELFDDGHLSDWNAVDWFCVKVLGPWVESLPDRGGESPRVRLGRAISEWRSGPGLWRRRASAVAFVHLAKQGDSLFDGFVDEVLESCVVLVSIGDRFSQTGAGWVLRELSTAEPDRVCAFIESHGASMTTEALASARRKLPE